MSKSKSGPYPTYVYKLATDDGGVEISEAAAKAEVETVLGLGTVTFTTRMTMADAPRPDEEEQQDQPEGVLCNVLKLTEEAFDRWLDGTGASLGWRELGYEPYQAREEETSRPRRLKGRILIVLDENMHHDQEATGTRVFIWVKPDMTIITHAYD